MAELNSPCILKTLAEKTVNLWLNTGNFDCEQLWWGGLGFGALSGVGEAVTDDNTDRLWKKNSKEKVRAKRARWDRRKFREDRDISGAGSTIRDNNNLAALGAALGRKWPL